MPLIKETNRNLKYERRTIVIRTSVKRMKSQHKKNLIKSKKIAVIIIKDLIVIIKIIIKVFEEIIA